MTTRPTDQPGRTTDPERRESSDERATDDREPGADASEDGESDERTGNDASDEIRVLNLVTTEEARFYMQQVDVLEERGVSCTTVSVPSQRTHDGDEVDGRSVTDYLQFYRTAIRHSFDDYDLIHANYGLTAPAAVLQPNLPVVLSLWGSDLLGEYDWVSKLCARASDEVIVMADHMADELGQDCRVIPHGIDLERFRPRPQREAQAELGWDPDSQHVLFPYAPTKRVKNPERAERVVAAARDRLDAPVELQFVTGVPHERMPTYVNAADALLLTSNREGSPNSVKEAMACNVPVVSTDVGDVRQRLTGATHSFVGRNDAELVDCLVSVLEAGERTNGREVVREISLENMGDRILEVYRAVLED